MPALANTALTFSAIGNREGLADVIYNIDPVDTPFQRLVGKSTALAVQHDWLTENLAAAGANAVVEGDDTTNAYTFSAPVARQRPTNMCQISRKDAVVSGTQDAVRKAGRKREMTRELMAKGKELRRDMEFVLCSNQAPVTGNATTARQLRPLCGWHVTNVSRGAGGASGTASAAATDGTQRAITEALVQGVVQSIWANGGTADTIMVGAANKTRISAFTGNATRFQNVSDGGNGGRLQAAFDIYVSDFGRHRVVPNRFQRARDCHLLSTDLWSVAYLRGPITEDLAKTGDNEKAHMIAEYTLEARNERGSGVVADLTV